MEGYREERSLDCLYLSNQRYVSRGHDQCENTRRRNKRLSFNRTAAKNNLESYHFTLGLNVLTKHIKDPVSR